MIPNKTSGELPPVDNPVLGTFTGNELIVNRFKFLNQNSDQSVTKFVTYKPPKLIKGKSRWWIQYYYRIPNELGPGPTWRKFRVFEDINRYKSDEYAGALLEAVSQHLANGYNPFKYEIEKIATLPGAQKAPSLEKALNQFQAQCIQKGLRKKTVQSYTTAIELLKKYFLNDGNRLYQPPAGLTKQDIKAFLIQGKGWNSWNNNTYNNYLGYINIIFNWMVNEDFIEKNPAGTLERLPVNVSRNTYYDDQKATAIKKLMAGTYISQFCEFIYYTGIRPKSEARLLRVENILLDRMLIYVPGEVSKNRTGDYVPICDELMALLKKMDLDQYPGHYYLWSISGHPAERPAGQNHFATLYKKYKDKLKLGPDYSIYSWKHTRAIDLANAGANPYEIMKLFRHSSLEQTIIYLRGIGCNISQEINDKTKKF